MMGRLDASTDEVFDKMVESGCVGMRFGVETFDKKVLKNINKGLERIDFQQTIERLSTKYPKLMIRLFMMKNLPGQTEETHKNDMKILKNLGFSLSGNIYRQIQLSNTAPFPGTKMYDDLKKLKGEKALKNYKLYDGGQTTIMDKL